MGTVSRTYDFTAGTTAVADEVDTDLNTLYTLVNGNLDDDNLADSAVTTAKINNQAVDSNKLGNDSILEVHVDYNFTDGPKITKFGPNYPASGSEFRFVPVTYSLTSPTGGGPLSTVDTSVTFNTGSFTLYGNFTWTAAPFLISTVPLDGSAADDDIPDVYWLTASSTTGATIRHKWDVDAASATAVTMYALFWGLV